MLPLTPSVTWGVLLILATLVVVLIWAARGK